MQIQLVKLARVRDKNIAAAALRYHRLVHSYAKITSLEYKEPKKFSKTKNSIIIALDGRGEQWSSEKLSSVLEVSQQQSHIKKVSFVVGGPYGISKDLHESSDYLWSLSNATLAGDIAWLVAWEQIYRALCILNRHPYHHS